jgi:DivIVA domain-containing protein
MTALALNMPQRLQERDPDAEIAAPPDVRFSTAVRGYDREAVDQYVSRVNQVLEEETKGLLERVHETADEITRRSRSQADDRIQHATQEAQPAARPVRAGGPPASRRRRP